MIGRAERFNQQEVREPGLLLGRRESSVGRAARFSQQEVREPGLIIGRAERVGWQSREV